MKPILLKGKESSIEQLMALSLKALNLTKNTLLKEELTTYDVANSVNSWLRKLAATLDMPGGHIEILKDVVYAFNAVTNFTVEPGLKSYDLASAIDGVLREHEQTIKAEATEPAINENKLNEEVVQRHFPPKPN